MAFSDAKQCTATSKSTGKRCKNPAVAGRNVCRLHGGNAGAPIKHGRYSLKHRAALAEKMDAFLSDNAPGDLTHELALTRALLQDYLERFTDGQPLPASDIERIFGMIEAIGRMVERIARILNSTALTQVEVQFLQARLADLLVKYIDDPDDRIAFMGELAESFGGNAGRAGTPARIASGTGNRG